MKVLAVFFEKGVNLPGSYLHAQSNIRMDMNANDKRCSIELGPEGVLITDLELKKACLHPFHGISSVVLSVDEPKKA